MQQLQALIGKLKEQFEQTVPASQMLATLRLIEAELHYSYSQGSAPVNKGTAKVAVVMPPGSKNAIFEPAPKVILPTIEANPEPVGEIEQPPVKKQEPWFFDPMREIPTLSHQQSSREINDMIGTGSPSLNDKLKDDVVELAAALKDSPVRELKKAIGINDRYVFVKELFRGDEAMYERSIKTINNFRIMPEAEYWMERELKVKLGWDDSRDITRHFYQLVKRRFS